MRFRVSIVGAAGIMPGKCPKCTVDAVVLVEPSHSTIAKVAINKLRLKVRDVSRVRLCLKAAVREHAAGTELPSDDTDLTSYLANGCVLAVSVHDSPPPELQSVKVISAATTRQDADATAVVLPAQATAVLLPMDVLAMPDVLGLLSSPLGVRAFFTLSATCHCLRKAVTECESGPWWRSACEQWSPLLAALKQGHFSWRDLFLKQLERARQAWRDEE